MEDINLHKYKLKHGLNRKQITKSYFFDNGNKSSGFSMIMRTANTSRLLQLRTVA